MRSFFTISLSTKENQRCLIYHTMSDSATTGKSFKLASWTKNEISPLIGPSKTIWKPSFASSPFAALLRQFSLSTRPFSVYCSCRIPPQKVGYRPPGGSVVVLGDWRSIRHCVFRVFFPLTLTLSPGVPGARGMLFQPPSPEYRGEGNCCFEFQWPRILT